MIKVIYSRRGAPISDFDVEDEIAGIVEKINEGDVQTYAYSTENMIYALRLAIGEGKIDFEKIVFLHKGLELKPTRYGTILHHPRGFADFVEQMNEKILWSMLKDE